VRGRAETVVRRAVAVATRESIEGMVVDLGWESGFLLIELNEDAE
jgi:hypothetical protein